MLVLFLLLTAGPGLCVRDYYFIGEQKNFSEAQRFCRHRFSDLATIDGNEDVDILNMIATQEVPHAWIGLYDSVDSWKWSLSDTSFYRAGEEEFRRWKPGQPSNALGVEHCTVILTDGLWYDVSFTASRRAVCSDVTGQDVTFVLTDDHMTWAKAQSYCRKHHTDLASVRNQAENQKVQELVQAAGGDRKAFIGLYRDSWKWSDGSNSSFRYWISGEPNGYNENCAAADFSSYSGQWADVTCDQRLPFICNGPAKCIFELYDESEDES
ncbi:macrophage mannose receptor 1-like [Centropristis striata]|uniref:macrophage mannose receptor 1-like n=1 Tax=Centropristis striata TaxID=184440 RepID=UPI0027E1F07D|nr:macrophage mannose receptor 1-like [Centropristis striata]